jgi:hypothetical protein
MRRGPCIGCGHSSYSGDRTHPNARRAETQATDNALVVLVATPNFGKVESRVRFAARAL